jgi:signal transduction histidine kinase
MRLAQRGIPFVASLVAVLTTGLLGLAAVAHAADHQKRVLLLFSTRRDAQFAIVAERTLPSLLAHDIRQGVDYYSEYIDSPRFSERRYQKAFHDFLRLKFEAQHIDLIIAVGSLAFEFLAHNRDTLFPSVPVVFYVLEPQRVRMTNATGLLNELHFNRSLDLAMALQPDLEHVYVVSGAGAADRRYERQARREFQPFEPRVELTYFSGLVMRDLETRLKKLPPHSAVYVVLGTKDGAGENFQQMDYLSRVASSANAPTYSWADTGVEAGIVGGSRRDQSAEMKAIATLALRVLHGARADRIPVSSPNLDVNQVDWRQLRRWGISDARLPAGTTVLFRTPSVWDQYRGYIVGAIVLGLAQTVLIAGLLVQRSQRRQSELERRYSDSRLRATYARIRYLGARLLQAQDMERARVSGELHDNIGQQLAVLAISLDSCQSRRGPLDRARLSEAAEQVRSISASVRTLSHQLHPGWLHVTGLVAAIDDLKRGLSRSNQQIAFNHRDVPPTIEPNVAVTLFRVAQEGLNNAIKHSNARNVWVELCGGPADVELTISDDGKGFEAHRWSGDGIGLMSMRERVESVGGVLEIHSTQGSGTHLRIAVPMRVESTAVCVETASVT